ncbi:hypothetical protein ACTHOQ_05345 [Solibacillus silvestris]|uniref:hypothetical protein n=1 Tax=Solibacillus silvestris TaxID=76853 RepID=UPI003F81FA0E
MKANKTSHILKILLVLFAIGVIFIGVYVLPTMAEEMSILYPELDYAKLRILIACELLSVLLLAGIGIIIYLLALFDSRLVFDRKFIRGTEILACMCIVASIGMIILFQYMRSFGGPGPLLALMMIGIIIVIWIVAAGMLLTRNIVKKGQSSTR